MQLIQINAHTWVIQGGANIGVISYEGRCLIIDSGMDKDVGREILQHVKKLGLTPSALLITHAHADHFGGADYLVRQTGLKVYATRVEAAVMSGPILEPLYLFSGAQPPRELQHKFLLAKPCSVDTILVGNEKILDQIPLQILSLPGHSSEQVGVAFADTLFAGDAFLTPAILDKHRIPFYSDVQAGLTTLNTLKRQTSSFKHIVAGHGEIYTAEQQANRAIDYTIERLESILKDVLNALADGTPRTTADVLSAVATSQGATINALSQYVLYQTTVQSALSTLYASGELQPIFQDNQLRWQRVGKA
ncbi:MBL fold metallo-hydrolase [Ktedonosporobacter rubrisoli]|uniref:beta-lactamase n=1 Tax=Ktedonosporobacter rubrisoli TaxID=2509675 RepID=A0A4P6JT20_KTERU|nr:MBL fold metallo-hydrolase [Ktedonosporobacter rubrisoli]QBD78445.1 MBL fold metallo-hydrolase [Ktedonosporobacter rubrisoli]